jgi:CRP-like cAMP-binding protein
MAERPGNQILDQLLPAEREHLLKGAKKMDLVLGEVLHRPEDKVDYVIFPLRGVISIIAENELGEYAEAGVIGREAGALLPEALGSGVAMTTGVVQFAGEALKVRASECRRLYAESANFRAALAAAVEFQLVEGRQSLLCRSFHKVENRLARWILEQVDRSNRDDTELVLTQEFMASMLAVHRPTVSRAAKALQHSGAIDYRRGRLTLVSKSKLESYACPCRATLHEQRARIFARSS